jgi:uncharacterized surface protein with fasciclin (FAS1) repeats
VRNTLIANNKMKLINNYIMKSKLTIVCLVLLTFASVFHGCIDDAQDRFDPPAWLGGSNIETLEGRGNYTHYLALMDKAGYRVSIERQRFTMFAPNDSAFEAYFEKVNKNSVDDFSKEEAKEIFGQSIIGNGRTREQLIYEINWGAIEDSVGEYGALFHRKETYGTPADYYERGVMYDFGTGLKNQDIRIRRTVTWVPLFTTEYFHDYFGDAQYDYEFMFPESKWREFGMAWGEGSVTEIGRTSSGFIYFVDKVVAPMPTINKYLYENPNKYSLFYNIAQNFATYSTPRLTEDKTENTYEKSYSEIMNIAQEKGPGGGVETWQNSMFTAYVPTNEALQEFINKTLFQNGYTQLDSTVPMFFYEYLVQSQINNRLSLPSKMIKREVNFYGDTVYIDVDTDINKSATKMCSNGIVYETKRYFEPNVFSCVPGPIFYKKDYTTFLYALNEAQAISALTKSYQDVTLFAPSNDLLLSYGIRTNIDNNGNTYIEVEKVPGSDTWMTMKGTEIIKFVGDYYQKGVYGEDNFAGEGYIRMTSNNYLHYKDGFIYGGGNQNVDAVSVKEKIDNERNGNLLYLDNTIKRPSTAGMLMKADPDLSEFFALLDSAKLIAKKQNPNNEDKNDQIYFVSFMDEKISNQWTVLAPTNQAIADARAANLIPSVTSKDTLVNFLKYHFVKYQAAFDDNKFSGIATTESVDTVISKITVYETLTFNSNGVYNLSVQDKTGQVVTINHADADRLVEMGVLHKINKVLITKQ